MSVVLSFREGRLGLACGNCGGKVFMATCDHFRGTGHPWALVSLCMICRAVHWTSDGCRECDPAKERS